MTENPSSRRITKRQVTVVVILLAVVPLLLLPMLLLRDPPAQPVVGETLDAVLDRWGRPDGGPVPLPDGRTVYYFDDNKNVLRYAIFVTDQMVTEVEMCINRPPDWWDG